MKFAQLHMLVSICENNLNVSQASRSLEQAQSAVSKQVQLFESELGQQIFVRRGKRLTALTPFGREILGDTRKIILLEEQIRIKASEYANDTVRGDLRIGTTHLQAKHVLPQVIQEFRRIYPNVFLQIHQSNPRTIFEMLTNNRVDIGICTEVLSNESKDITAERAYSWNRCLVVPPGHPLAKSSNLALKDLATYPLITYVRGFTGRGAFDDTFEEAKLIPNIVFSASDSDIIKTYVNLGMGVGVIAEQAYDEEADSHLVSRDLSHLFPQMHTLMAWRRDKYPSAGFSKFISIFRERVSRSRANGA
jgi:LysR family cys regulon transcriptional activator